MAWKCEPRGIFPAARTDGLIELLKAHYRPGGKWAARATMGCAEVVPHFTQRGAKGRGRTFLSAISRIDLGCPE